MSQLSIQGTVQSKHEADMGVIEDMYKARARFWREHSKQLADQNPTAAPLSDRVVDNVHKFSLTGSTDHCKTERLKDLGTRERTSFLTHPIVPRVTPERCNQARKGTASKCTTCRRPVQDGRRCKKGSQYAQFLMYCAGLICKPCYPW